MPDNMFSPRNLKLFAFLVLLIGAGLFVTSCSGSKANVRKEETSAAANEPVAIEVTTAAAIKRDLPRFFEATGSLAGDEQTDVAPQTAGKVVAVGVDIGSFVKRGQMLASEQRKLDAGQSTTFLVLERQTTLTNARSMELKAQTDLNKAIADLQRATGNALRANSVVVSAK
jgi:multidrug efflux pump subunit AcrA (membrane-fusion protein)